MRKPLRTITFTCVLLLPACASQAQSLPPEASNPAVRAAIDTCTGDAKKLCSGVLPGGGRIVRCLAANEASLTEACRTAMLKAKTALGR
ncbi:MAG: hypothetical protein ACKVP7_13770 [Hyphomicrobiaceae bacterium]